MTAAMPTWLGLPPELLTLRNGLVLAVLLVAVALAVLCFCLDRRLVRLDRENAALRQRLAQARRPAQERKEEADREDDRREADFAATLARAQVQALPERPQGEAPERYRLLVSLASRGVAAAELEAALEILRVSPQEAEQLVRLCRLTRSAADDRP